MSPPASHAASWGDRGVNNALAWRLGGKCWERMRQGIMFLGMRDAVSKGPPPAGDEPPPPPPLMALYAISANYAVLSLGRWTASLATQLSTWHGILSCYSTHAPAESDMIVTLLAASGLLHVVGGLIATASEHGRLLSRRKRYLTFPEGSAVTVRLIIN